MSGQDELESQEDVEVHKWDSEGNIRCQFRKDENNSRYAPVANVDADVGVDLGQFKVALLQRKIHTTFPKTHLGVNMHAWLCSPSLLA